MEVGNELPEGSELVQDAGLQEVEEVVKVEAALVHWKKRLHSRTANDRAKQTAPLAIR
jgi:hypothetical protein